MKTLVAYIRNSRLGLGGVLALCAFIPCGAGAQSIAPRITQAVDDSARVTLRGNVPGALRTAVDQGEVADSTPMTHMHLLLSRSDAQEQALEQYLAELQQKSSPNYHKWLTPGQFGTLYGPADSDIAAVRAWLESKGFAIAATPPGRTSIEFAGTANQVRQAFGTPIHAFAGGGRQFLSNISDPTVPSALAAVVGGVANLNTIPRHPLSRRVGPASLDLSSGKRTLVNANASTGGFHPELSYQNSSAYNYLFVVPGDAATIYDTPNSLNANFSSGTSYTGSGVTIGVIGDAAISTTPVTNFRTNFIGDSNVPTIFNLDSTSNTGDADEAYLDVELAGGLAPGASVDFYTASDNTLSAQIGQALTDNAVDILSISFGSCEGGDTTAGNKQISAWWQQAAVQGIAVTISTGDSGSAGCDVTQDSNGNNITAATYGLAVNGLASTPYNIAVGGTDYYDLETNFSNYATVPSGASSIAGSAATFYRTAKTYIPEMVWNDALSVATVQGSLSKDAPYTGTSSSGASLANIVAASGGKSSCSTNSNTTSPTTACTSGWAKPTWQRGTGVPSDGVRDLPDISLLGADGSYGAAWVVCDNYTDTTSNVTYNCSSVSSSLNFDLYGGTSTSAPAFAGMLALVQQSQGGGRLGQAAAELYNIYNNSASASTIFHDVTKGNNSVPCTSGTPNCTKNSAGNYFLTGYDATTGYDLASGLGSADVSKLIANWSSATGSAKATVTVTPSSTTVSSSDAPTISIAVSGSSGTATGSVVLKTGTYTSLATALNGGVATVTIPASFLAAGTYTLTATYSGDGTYSGATGTASLVVASTTLTASTTTLTASTAAPTAGAAVTLTAIVAPTAATGTVVFYDGTTPLGSKTLASGTAALSTTALSVGAHTITALYGGDGTYAASTSAATTVTVANPTPTIGTTGGTFTLAATNITVKQYAAGTSTVTITSKSYAGTVNLTLSASDATVQNNGCYAVSSPSVTSNATATTTLTIYTSANQCTSTQAKKFTTSRRAVTTSQSRTGGTSPQAWGWQRSLPAGGLAVAGLLMFGIRKRRAKLAAFLGGLVLLGFVGLATGCGGGGSSATAAVAKGTYTVTLDGADSTNTSNTATTTFALVVN